MLASETKNVDGRNGPICNNCGGYGFTNLMTGGSGGCRHCEQTGVEPVSNKELVERIRELESKIIELSNN